MRLTNSPQPSERPEGAREHPGPYLSAQSNNFDLLRLLAALQVVVAHGSVHLGLSSESEIGLFQTLISYFPGVPIFFVISGFLISRSWERSGDLPSYFRNRYIRIYPALWVAFLAALALVSLAGFVGRAQLCSVGFWFWVTAQLSFVQFYNPAFLRGFGVGVLNGSLWTIPVELAFYCFLPLFYRFGLDRLSRRSGDVLIALFAALSGAVFILTSNRIGSVGVDKVLQVTLAPHLFMFLFGVALQRHMEVLGRIIEGQALAWFGIYVVLMIASSRFHLESRSGLGALVLLQRGLLAVTVVSSAYTWRGASERCLRNNDLSYGVYLYHMLVVNALVQLGLRGHIIDLVGTLALTVVLASLSWKLVEAPALRRKRHAMRYISGYEPMGGASSLDVEGRQRIGVVYP